MPTLLPGGEMTGRYKLFRQTMTLLAKILFAFEAHGSERVPKQGALVIAANHRRLLDPAFVGMATPRRMQWMAKKELFAPPFDRVFDLLGAFPVDRQAGGRGALRKALDYLGEGWALGIFPEGTRRREDDPTEIKNGAVMLAARAQAAIVPVYLGEIPSLKARLLKGEKFQVYVGEPLKLDNTIRGREAYREAAEKMMASIYALPKREESS